jgi:hypothetical protein
MGSEMEADWEFEVDGEAPVIDAAWDGFVDLRLQPECANELAETAGFPALAGALTRLNSDGSPVWTSKCDMWPVIDRAEWDADELDAPPDIATHAAGCYIDLLARDEQQWLLPAVAAETCTRFCERMHSIPMGCCRADLVIRRAVVAAEKNGAVEMEFGITAYLTGCGASDAEAAVALEGALHAFAGAILVDASPAGDGSKLQ